MLHAMRKKFIRTSMSSGQFCVGEERREEVDHIMNERTNELDFKLK